MSTRVMIKEIVTIVTSKIVRMLQSEKEIGEISEGSDEIFQSCI